MEYIQYMHGIYLTSKNAGRHGIVYSLSPLQCRDTTSAVQVFKRDQVISSGIPSFEVNYDRFGSSQQK